MLTKWRLRITEPLRSVFLSAFWGGVIPYLSFHSIIWMENQYYPEKLGQIYFPSPGAIPICCAFSIISFPAIAFFLTLGMLQKSFGNPPFMDTLDPMSQIGLVLALSLIFNICVHWIFWRFVWRDKSQFRNDTETDSNFAPNISGADVLGSVFLFFAFVEFFFNSRFLLSNLTLLAIGLSLLAYAYICRKREQSRLRQTPKNRSESPNNINDS